MSRRGAEGTNPSDFRGNLQSPPAGTIQNPRHYGPVRHEVGRTDPFAGRYEGLLANGFDAPPEDLLRRHVGLSLGAAIDVYGTGIRNPVRWRLEVLDVGGNPDLAYQVGRSHLTSRGGDGQERTYTTDFVVVWERQPDGWLRMILDLWN